jgi:methyl-accepting chemotaxis protein
MNMPRWSFGQKLGLGYAAMVLLVLIVSAVALYGLFAVAREKDHLVRAEQLDTSVANRMAANRGYFLTKDNLYIKQKDAARSDFETAWRAIRSSSTPDESTLLNEIEKASNEQAESADKLIERRKNGATIDEVAAAFPVEIVPKADAVVAKVKEFTELQQRQTADVTSLAVDVTVGMAGAAAVIAVVLAWLLSRVLSRQIGSAVQHMQSSSAELQAAANQQTAGSKEQVASMNEISTTIRELMSTARQIAESAQHVTQIADDTTGAARAGDGAVRKAQSDVGGIRQQVDQIVNHMLSLGRKSQQIGGILEIINELAEQTNILAINATIEAAGAGEAGKRFSVVADEIRKLADRVGGSTKEIRALIEEIRAAVNTTVMATESGSKAVDVAVRQFSEVAGTFQRIVELLGTTNEAARQIELSTKQQSSAVEQVNIAVANVAQAARESEASSSQVLQTVGELTNLSQDLGRLIQASPMNGRMHGAGATRV